MYITQTQQVYEPLEEGHIYVDPSYGEKKSFTAGFGGPSNGLGVLLVTIVLPIMTLLGAISATLSVGLATRDFRITFATGLLSLVLGAAIIITVIAIRRLNSVHDYETIDYFD